MQHFEQFDSEVYDIQADDFSVGIFNGWVTYGYNSEVYEIDYNDCLYLIYEKASISEIIEKSKIFKED